MERVHKQPAPASESPGLIHLMALQACVLWSWQFRAGRTGGPRVISAETRFDYRVATSRERARSGIDGTPIASAVARTAGPANQHFDCRGVLATYERGLMGCPLVPTFFELNTMNDYDSSSVSGNAIAGDYQAVANTLFRDDICHGLRRSSKYIPSKYLYDDRGSHLFDAICRLDEYYPTRSELNIMRHHAVEIAGCLGEYDVLVELGSGSSEKTRVLLEHLPCLGSYLPVDISVSHLMAAADRIRLQYPTLEVQPLVCDFTELIDLPDRFSKLPLCTYFPGSTIGNLEPSKASDLLSNIQQMNGQRSGLLIGFDLQKDPDVLHRAYNDSKGITAAFSLNLLQRMNRELDADFDLSQFRHLAFYNSRFARIEIYIESLRQQSVFVAGEEFYFRRGERVLTEYSHKYTIAGFARLAEASGFSMQRFWTDDRNYFAVAYLTSSVGR